MQTDRTIPNNKPDIIIRDNEKGTCVLIDVAIPADRNVIKKEAEKILKYKDLTIFNWTPPTARSKGRPKQRWEDNIIQDIRQLNIKNWTVCV